MTTATRKLPRDARYGVRADGTIIGLRGKPLVPHVIKGGYHRVRINGKHQLVHVLVAEAFIGPRPEGHEVNHTDGRTGHNAASNLEYLTRSANVRHSIDVLGSERAPGEKNANAKLTDEAVVEMRDMHDRGISTGTIAARFNIHYSHVWRIVTRRSWRHLK